MQGVPSQSGIVPLRMLRFTSIDEDNTTLQVNDSDSDSIFPLICGSWKHASMLINGKEACRHNIKTREENALSPGVFESKLELFVQ